MYQYDYPHPAITADCVVFAGRGEKAQVLLIKRKFDPCKGMWAFPGGFMNIDETADAAAVRELYEETGLRLTDVHQIGAFSRVDRDPRERVVNIAYYTEIAAPIPATGGDDAAEARWFPLADLPPLAFDHAEILARAIYIWNLERK